MNIVIVGAGKASLTLMEYFSSDQNIQLLGVSDIQESAPGMIRAQELGIPVTTKMESIIQNQRIDLVIELTGIQRVRDSIIGMLQSHQQLMTSESAKVMVEMIESQKQQNGIKSEKLSSEFKELNSRFKKAVEVTDTSIKSVREVLFSMKIVAINAGIEAARSGEAGVAFGVVAEEMKEMVAKAGSVLASINEASRETYATLKALQETEKRLEAMFRNQEKP